MTSKPKITIRDVWGTIKKPADTDKPRDIMHVVGIASGVRYIEDKYKPGETCAALYGQFEATNAETGEIFCSSRCYLPESVQMEVVKQVESGKFDAIQFALSIGYKPSKNRSGYEFTVKHLSKMSAVDMLEGLRSFVPSKKKA